MPTAYIETTIPSYYVARPSTSLIQAARQASTRAWWDAGYSGFALFTCQETLEEVGRGDPAMADARLGLLGEVGLLEINPEVGALVKRLLATQIVPTKAASDAIHIAVASVHQIDFMVTWNFRHIANPHIRIRLRKEVSEFGAVLPTICTPEELMRDEND